MTYEEFTDLFKRVPKTWIPSLLVQIARVGYSNGLFTPGGASRLVMLFEVREGIVKVPEKGLEKASESADIESNGQKGPAK